ncbi:MAG: HEXXH motif-containing putative peptide modification protein [Nitrospira sp.]|nr:HEXXH motif-containing putative peptide modification protein [Nitrospira sp.]
MPLLDSHLLTRLTYEFRLSMRRLLQDLCEELQDKYAALANRLGLPIGLFEMLSRSLKLEAYSSWKGVGWIETLNDLVYFLDILQQWEREPHRREFTEQLFAECREKFFEHGYASDLFPSGRPSVPGFEKRLTHLCERLGREVTQEGLCFDPALAVKWHRRSGWTRSEVRGTLNADFERAHVAGAIAIGPGDQWLEVPHDLRRAIRPLSGRATFLVETDGLWVKIGRDTVPLWTGREQGEWRWKVRKETVALATERGPVTVGPTLVYGNDREPRTVAKTEQRHVERIARAWRTIQAAWPDGHAVLALLTSRIVPLKAKGVVSFSYRHRPGLSFINCFDRDSLDLIDDLIHENSHHHLNLLLRKYVLYHGDHNQQIFYSPWRRSLRPLRGILHATFTFTMGAMLFERLSAWASGRGGTARWKRAGLTQQDLQRAKYRCLEEVESVRYSLQDLHYADRHLGWLTASGRRLVCELKEAIDQVEHEIDRYRPAVLRSKFGPDLRRHCDALKQARLTYGPMRLSEV